jgi:hypothetical protein
MCRSSGLRRYDENTSVCEAGSFTTPSYLPQGVQTGDIVNTCGFRVPLTRPRNDDVLADTLGRPRNDGNDSLFAGLRSLEAYTCFSLPGQAETACHAYPAMPWLFTPA